MISVGRFAPCVHVCVLCTVHRAPCTVCKGAVSRCADRSQPSVGMLRQTYQWKDKKSTTLTLRDHQTARSLNDIGRSGFALCVHCVCTVHRAPCTVCKGAVSRCRSITTVGRHVATSIPVKDKNQRHHLRSGITQTARSLNDIGRSGFAPVCALCALCTVHRALCVQGCCVTMCRSITTVGRHVATNIPVER